MRCRRVHSRPNAAMARRVREQQPRLAAPGQQLVEVVRGRRAGAGVDALLEVRVVQQPEVPVVDQLGLLPFPQRLDGQPQLLLGLVHRLVVEIGDPGLDPQNRLRHAQLVLARRRVVVHERAGQRVLTGMAGGHLDRRLPVLVLRWPRPPADVVEMTPQRLGPLHQVVEVVAVQLQHRAPGQRLGGELPKVLRRLGEQPLTEIVAVGNSPEIGVVAVRRRCRSC